MCISKLSTLKSNTLRDILGLERESSESEDLQMSSSSNENVSNSPGVVNKDSKISDHETEHTYQGSTERDNLLTEHISEARIEQDKFTSVDTSEPKKTLTVGNDNLVAAKLPEGDTEHKSTPTASDKSNRITFSSDDGESDNEVLERKLREKLLRSLLASKKKNKS